MGFGKIKIRRADQMFSKFIRARDDWTCQRCQKYFQEGKRQGLHCSHYHGRAKESTRFDPDNCVALCHGCHSFFTANPSQHRDWQLNRLGEKRYNELLLRANTYKKKDDKLVILALKELNKNL